MMTLGAFSVSLAVKDIETSKLFYEALGFQVVGGEALQGWLILRNGDHTIGLFQGMFDNNLLTFNPGWDKDGNSLESFTDVRELHRRYQEQGIDTMNESMDDKQGPGSFSVVDPDGNMILFDQHV